MIWAKVQKRIRGKKLKHLQFSTSDHVFWRKWHYEFLQTTKGEKGPCSRELREDFLRKHHKEGFSLWGYAADKYDVSETYERARRKRDPLLSPHGFFRSLDHKNNLHAREFLENFGPLHWPGGLLTVPRQFEVELPDFWSYHLRFCMVAQLWEARNSKSELLKAWRHAYEHYGELIKELEPLGFGERFGSWYDPPRIHYPYVWPWQYEKKDFESWGRETPIVQLRDYALQLIGSELNLHVSDCEIMWERCWEPTKEQFRQSIRTKSLWSSIWQLFGWDTCQLAWRRCPHCQKYFYPRRKDQFYCTSRQQGLASKRNYARRMRSKEPKKGGTSESVSSWRHLVV